MSKGYTEIVYILDRSGSMGGLEADTIGGFNSMMEKKRKQVKKLLYLPCYLMMSAKCFMIVYQLTGLKR